MYPHSCQPADQWPLGTQPQHYLSPLAHTHTHTRTHTHTHNTRTQRTHTHTRSTVHTHNYIATCTTHISNMLQLYNTYRTHATKNSCVNFLHILSYVEGESLAKVVMYTFAVATFNKHLVLEIHVYVYYESDYRLYHTTLH